mgnify:CR=1 FL=1|jgi:antitoxin HigA-1
MMHNPPHPGEFIQETYLDPFDISHNAMAERLNVAGSTFNRLAKGESSVSPEMAYRLSRVLGRSPESWLNLQAQYDLFETRKCVSLKGLRKLNFTKFAGARAHR